MKDLIIRWQRIISHSIAFIITKEQKHSYEVSHYFYMKSFTKEIK